MGRIFQGRENVLSLQEGVVRQDFLKRSSSAQQCENIANAQPEAANTRPPAAFTSFHSNSIEPFEIHEFARNLTIRKFPFRGKERRPGSRPGTAARGYSRLLFFRQAGRKAVTSGAGVIGKDVILKGLKVPLFSYPSAGVHSTGFIVGYCYTDSY
jgi:hypothetical protein